MKILRWIKLILLFGLLPIVTHADDLMTVYQQALQADPRLFSADLQVQIGEDRRGQSLGAMYPQITASANWSENHQRNDIRGANNYPGTRYHISLTQTIFDVGKFWQWKRSAKVINQAQADKIEAHNRLMFDVVDRYFQVLEAEDQLIFMQKTKKITAKQLLQIQKLFEKQMIKITDVYEVEARLDKYAADVIEAETVLAVALEGLSELTYQTHEKLQILADDIQFQVLDGKIQDWMEVAKAQNPTLIAQLNAIDAADDEVLVRQADHYPVMEMQLNYHDSDTGFDSTASPRTETQYLAFNINVPIFSGGVTSNRISEARHQLTMAKYELKSKVRVVIKETKDAFLTANTSHRRITAAKKALRSAVKSRQAMEKGFSYGVETVMDVLDSWQNEYLSQRNVLQAKYAYIRNKVRFLYAIGTINEHNLQEINQWLMP